MKLFSKGLKSSRWKNKNALMYEYLDKDGKT